MSTHAPTLNFEVSDSRPETLKFTLDEIMKGFSNRTDIENFIRNNNIFSPIDENKLNHFIWHNDLAKRLKEFNVNINDFENILTTHNAKLTGSFLLQIISGEKYDNYDIDLYVDNITNELQNDIMNLCHAVIEDFTPNPKDPKYMEQIVKEVKNFIVPNKMKDHNGHMTKPLKFQLIKTVDKYKGIELYLDTFDFDILQNYYDGIKFNVRSIENIKKKVAVYNETFFGTRTFIWIVRRIKKYDKRGFDIHFGLNFLKYAIEVKMTNENQLYYKSQFKLKNDIGTIVSGFEFLMAELKK